MTTLLEDLENLVNDLQSDKITKKQVIQSLKNIVEYEEKQCEDCQGKGYIFTYAKHDNFLSIERCDTCKKFNNDDEAKNFVREEVKQ
jgi:hypothetical protein